MPLTTADLNAAVSPYRYNPSAWNQRLPVCVLAWIACLIASYMALYQWRMVDSVWDPIFGEQTAKVLDSKVAKRMHDWVGIPDAALGALAYLGDAIFGLAGSTRRWQYRPWMVILFGIDVIPLGIVSIILVILQGTMVGYWCFLCLVTAAISMVLIYMAVDEVYVSLKYLFRFYRDTKSLSKLWRVFWGLHVPEADKVANTILGEAN